MTILCPTCHGKGTIPNPNVTLKENQTASDGTIPCKTCNKDGWVSVQDEVLALQQCRFQKESDKSIAGS